MSMHRPFVLFPISLVFVLASTAVLAAPPRFEEVLPNRTMAYITVRNVPQLVQGLREAGVLDVLNEPEVKQFLELPLARLRELTESEVGLSMEDIGRMFQGQVSLALLDLQPPPVAGEGNVTPHLAAMIDVGDRGEAMMALIARLEAKAKEKDANAFQRVEEEFGGTRIIGLMPMPRNNAPAPKPQEAFHYAVHQDVFIAGTPLDAVKQTIAGLSNPPDASLATNGLYNEMLQRVGKEMEITGFVNIQGMVNTALQKMSAQEKLRLNAFGADTLVAGAFGNRRRDRLFETRALLKTSGEKRGLVAALMPEAGEQIAASEIPPDAHVFWSVRIDLINVWQTVRQIVRVLQPQADVQYDQAMNNFSQMLGQPFDVEKDVLGVFGKRFGGYQAVAGVEENKSSRFVGLIDLQSKQAFQNLWDTLGRVLPPIAQSFQTEEYLGHQLRIRRAGPAGPAEAAPPPAKGLTFCVLENRLVISDYREETERFLRSLTGLPRSLKDMPGYQLTANRLPDTAYGAFLYMDQRPGMKANLDKLKSMQEVLGQALRDAVQKAPPMLKPLLESIDLSKLPSGEVIAPYMMVGSACFVPLEDGLEFMEIGIPARFLEQQTRQ